jgi:hypothetical protein
MKRPISKPATLPDTLEQRLSSYALAASAAGVGMLALGQAADAEIVYTKANVLIRPGTYFRLDVNHDGFADFTISNATYFRRANRYSTVWDWVYVWGRQISKGNYNAVVATQPVGFAADLPPNAHVGKRRTFGVDYAQPMANCEFQFSTIGGSRSGRLGPWKNVQSRYLGLRFSVAGQTHYGWARLNVKFGNKCSSLVTLTGYAYETIPGKAILAGATKGPDEVEPSASLNTPAPEPGTLCMLALGAPGLAIWRREESAVAVPQRN